MKEDVGRKRESNYSSLNFKVYFPLVNKQPNTFSTEASERQCCIRTPPRKCSNRFPCSRIHQFRTCRPKHRKYQKVVENYTKKIIKICPFRQQHLFINIILQACTLMRKTSQFKELNDNLGVFGKKIINSILKNQVVRILNR